MSPLEALIVLNSLPHLGPIRIRRLLDHCGNAAATLKASESELLRVDGIGPNTATTIRHWQEHCDPTKELDDAKQRDISILCRDDELYPDSLRQVYDAPVLLYVWGQLQSRDRHAIAVVGSRRSTHYGTQTTRKLSFQLARNGYTILSGLARGIDTAAHEAAVAAGGRTIAVIGSGLAKLYPPENLGLAERIADGHGAVVSEFPLHIPPSPQTFPMRNRIVAAWSQAVLVTECPAWSGAIITANLAAEYGKCVFAVPGPIDKPSSSGCHQLIREGATLVTDANELTDDLGQLRLDPPQTTAAQTPQIPEAEARILAWLSQAESTVDEVIERSGLSPSVVSSGLIKLTLKGLARNLPGNRYSLP